MDVLFAAIIGYLIGSLSFAVLCSAAFGLPDPRTYGSGNPGATNVLRTGKRSAAILTFLGDAAKGAVAVWTVRAIGWADGAVAAAALAAFLGHLWPLYFGFRGGKGVATAFGILLSLSMAVALTALFVFLLVVAVVRYVSLASVLAGIAAGIAAAALFGAQPIAFAVVAMVLLVIVRHGSNIRRLLDGTERKLGQKSKAAAEAPSESPAVPDPNAAER